MGKLERKQTKKEGNELKRDELATPTNQQASKLASQLSRQAGNQASKQASKQASNL